MFIIFKQFVQYSHVSVNKLSKVLVNKLLNGRAREKKSLRKINIKVQWPK